MNVKPHYSGDEIRDFVKQCLTRSVSYYRGAAYFSSSVFLLWADALYDLAQKGGKVRLLISPVLSQEDIEALKEVLKLDEYAKDKLNCLVQEILKEGSSEEIIQWRRELLTWMIAFDLLEIRFAIPENPRFPGDYHVKIGLFEFEDGSKAAFTGSVNETLKGYWGNYESIDVFRSWIEHEKERVNQKEQEFFQAWEGNASGLRVFPLSEEALRHIRARAPEEFPYRPGLPVQKTQEDKWRHQQEALQAFIQAKRGILEMATGTGKTRTALMILETLLRQDEVDTIIISTHGNDLLEQWYENVLRWKRQKNLSFKIFRHYGTSYKELNSFLLAASDAQDTVLLISRDEFANQIDRIASKCAERTLIIHDEVHGLGAERKRELLKGKQKRFRYILGLSATPVREYDPEGTEFLFDEVGPIVYSFGLKEAIQRGILSEFDYEVLSYQLTEAEIHRLKEYQRKLVGLLELKKKGEAVSEQDIQQLQIQIARVFKQASDKIDRLRDYLSTHPKVLHRSIIFVDTKEFGKPILDILQELGVTYRTYYAEDERAFFKEFARGNIDVLITCHRIAQGVDIPDLRTIILVSSDKAKLETIQRIGRSLRINPEDPSKRALVIDFQGYIPKEEGNLEPVEFDRHRVEWLRDISKTKTEA